MTGASASCRVAQMRADASTSPAPLASETASGWVMTSGILGFTNTSSAKPMVFNARAADPTFPG
ncbi:Uncharacterised protein [Mycobacteroides abscessus subsp. abscessus]|nr:Uncharacterised protein [Mycobacteroides abscessus subsp. abscessus]